MRVFRPLRFALLLVPVLFASRCQTQPASILSGKITMQPGWRPVLYLVQPRSFGDIATSYAGVVVDSALVGSDGNFTFERFQVPGEPALYELVIQPEGSRYDNKLMEDDPELANYIPLVLKKGFKINIRAEAGRLQASAMTAPVSGDDSALFSLRDIRRVSFDRFLRAPADDAHADVSVMLEQAARLEQFRIPLMAFADTTTSYWAALVAIRWVSTESDYERVPELLHRQCSRWQATYPDHAFTQQLCQLCTPGKLPLMVGETISDFSLPMSEGDTAHLHTLLGKRLTLLDLWASWCAPCRRENREVLVPLQEKYRESGFSIVGYALDSSPEAWKAAIKKDAAAWPQASHLGGDTSPFLDMLHITTIPANFLLDANGKVVAKNLHGEALRAFVDAYLGE